MIIIIMKRSNRHTAGYRRTGPRRRFRLPDIPQDD
jgi:hypothetical protein